MKRFPIALLLTLLGSAAHAGGYSFSIGGHHITIEAGRHCRSLSCVSWSEGGSRRAHRDDAVATPATAKPVAPACPPAAAAPVAPETAAPALAPAPAAPPIPPPPPAPVRVQVAPPAVTPAPVVQPDIGRPKEKATVEATVADKPLDTPDWSKDWSPPARDAPGPKPAEIVAHVDDSPVGDWQTEGKKGLVRIEKCGAALCGYILNEAANTTAETVLSNMRAKTDAHWVGDIYSRASGNSYYAKMTFKQPDTLRVEACAIGRFFCSGNDWTRVPNSDEVMTSRDLPASPKS